MRFQYRLISITTALIFILATATAMAGWGDALKGAAEEGSKTMGLPYTPSEAMEEVKDVLSLGTDYATTSLSKPGGFSSTPATTFSLPDSFGSLGDTSGLLSSLNTAAEQSVPGTGNVFLDAIQKLSVGETSTLLGGGEDAITRFFENSSRDSIKTLVKPMVSQSVDAAGVGSYLDVLTMAQGASGVAGPAFDPTDFVTEKTLDGMFYFMGMKEKDIRSSGGVGTTDILEKLF